MLLPKSKSWVKARYIVKTNEHEEPILCRYDYKDKAFKKYSLVSSFGEGSWYEWCTVYGVISWVRVDTLI